VLGPVPKFAAKGVRTFTAVRRAVNWRVVPESRRTSLVLDALRLALATIATLPNGQEAQGLREQCEACEGVARRWAQVPPTAQEREAVMQRVVSLHVAVARVRRSTLPPPPDGSES
jgi:hypothetical protein